MGGVGCSEILWIHRLAVFCLGGGDISTFKGFSESMTKSCDQI